MFPSFLSRLSRAIGEENSCESIYMDFVSKHVLAPHRIYFENIRYAMDRVKVLAKYNKPFIEFLKQRYAFLSAQCEFPFHK